MVSKNVVADWFLQGFSKSLSICLGLYPDEGFQARTAVESYGIWVMEVQFWLGLSQDLDGFLQVLKKGSGVYS